MNKLIAIIVLITFIFTTTLYAAAPLKKGTPAPHDGILLTIEEDTKVKKDIIQLDIFKETYPYQEKRANMFKNHAIETMKENEKLRKQKKIERYIWFFGGVLVTGAAILGAKELSKIN